ITIGSLESDSMVPYTLTFLLDTVPNGQLLAKELLNSLCKIWDSKEGILQHKSQIRVFMSDGATYMTTAYNELITFGLDCLLHPTCIVHGLSNVINPILREHKIVSEFATLVEQSYCHSDKRKSDFKSCSNFDIEESLVKCLFKLCDPSNPEENIEKTKYS